MREGRREMGGVQRKGKKERERGGKIVRKGGKEEVRKREREQESAGLVLAGLTSSTSTLSACQMR